MVAFRGLGRHSAPMPVSNASIRGSKICGVFRPRHPKIRRRNRQGGGGGRSSSVCPLGPVRPSVFSCQCTGTTVVQARRRERRQGGHKRALEGVAFRPVDLWRSLDVHDTRTPMNDRTVSSWVWMDWLSRILGWWRKLQPSTAHGAAYRGSHTLNSPAPAK